MAMTSPAIPDYSYASTTLFCDPLTQNGPSPMAPEVGDDLDGCPADTTLTFTLDGKNYEIDYSDAKVEKLRGALPHFVAAARKASADGGPRGTRSIGARSSNSDPDTAKICVRAKANGRKVSNCGRIHESVKDAYYPAHWSKRPRSRSGEGHRDME